MKIRMEEDLGIDGVDHTFAGEPQEDGMMQGSSNFTWRRLSKVSTALFTTIDVDLHTITNKLLCPNETERLSTSSAC